MSFDWSVLNLDEEREEGSKFDWSAIGVPTLPTPSRQDTVPAAAESTRMPQPGITPVPPQPMPAADTLRATPQPAIPESTLSPSPTMDTDSLGTSELMQTGGALGDIVQPEFAPGTRFSNPEIEESSEPRTVDFDEPLPPPPTIWEKFTPEEERTVRRDDFGSPRVEAAFRKWYAEYAATNGINPDPDANGQKYNYRGFFNEWIKKDGSVNPTVDQNGIIHLPSEFKDWDHPNRFIRQEDGSILDSRNDEIVQAAPGPLDAWDKLAEWIKSGGVESMPFIGDAVAVNDIVTLFAAAHRAQSGYNQVDGETPEQAAERERLEQSDTRLLFDWMEHNTREKTWGYDLTEALLKQPAFWLEMAATGPLFGAGAKLTQNGVEAAGKKALKWMTSAAARKVIEGRAARLGIKAVTATAKTAVGAAFQAPVARALGIAADTVERMMPGGYLTADGVEMLEPSNKDPEFAKAFPKAVLNQYIEILSEHAGPGVNAAASLAKRGARAALVKAGLISSFVRANPGASIEPVRELFKRAAYDGWLGEMGEERIGDILRVMTGVESDLGWTDEDGNPDWRKFSIEGVSFAIPSALGVAASLSARSQTKRAHQRLAAQDLRRGIDRERWRAEAGIEEAGQDPDGIIAEMGRLPKEDAAQAVYDQVSTEESRKQSAALTAATEGRPEPDRVERLADAARKRGYPDDEVDTFVRRASESLKDFEIVRKEISTGTPVEAQETVEEVEASEVTTETPEAAPGAPVAAPEAAEPDAIDQPEVEEAPESAVAESDEPADERPEMVDPNIITEEERETLRNDAYERGIDETWINRALNSLDNVQVEGEVSTDRVRNRARFDNLMAMVRSRKPTRMPWEAPRKPAEAAAADPVQIIRDLGGVRLRKAGLERYRSLPKEQRTKISADGLIRTKGKPMSQVLAAIKEADPNTDITTEDQLFAFITGGDITGEAEVEMERAPEPVATQPIKWDARNGVGSVPNNQEVGYKGFELGMTPDRFRSLVPAGAMNENARNFAAMMRAGESFGQPFLDVKWDKKGKQWQVIGHEGRSRADAASIVAPTDNMPVHIFPRGMIAADITEEMRNAPIVPQEGAPEATVADPVIEAPTTLLEATTETPVVSGGRRVSFEVEGTTRTVNLTPEQTAEWDANEERYQRDLRSADRMQYENEAAKRRKAAGFARAAERRRITGQLTATEQKKADDQAQKVTVGKPVTVTTPEGTVVGEVARNPVFGKVLVRHEDGTEVSYDRSNVSVRLDEPTQPLEALDENDPFNPEAMSEISQDDGSARAGELPTDPAVIDGVSRIGADLQEKRGTDYGLRPVDSMRDDSRLARAMAHIYGHNVVFVDGSLPLPVTGSYDRGTIYVAMDANNHHVAVMGHELWHAVSQNRPELAKSFYDTLLEVDPQAVDKYRKLLGKRYRGNAPTKAAQSDAFLIEEYGGDILGEQMSNPVFLSKLQEKDPSVIQRIHRFVRQTIQKLKAEFNPGYSVESTIADLEKTQNALADVMKQYRAPAAATDAAPKFQEKYGETVSNAERGGGAQPGFYSAVRRVAAEKLPKAGGSQQIMATLKKAPGIKQEELDDLGLEEFLADKKKVSRDEVVAWIDGHSVQWEEVDATGDPVAADDSGDWRVYRDDENLMNFDSEEGAYEYVENLVDSDVELLIEEFNPDIEVFSEMEETEDLDEDGDPIKTEVWHVRGSNGDIEDFDTEEEAYDRRSELVEYARSDFEEYARDRARESYYTEQAEAETDLQYGEYVTEGGEDYHELRLTIPNNPLSDSKYRSPHWEEQNTAIHLRYHTAEDGMMGKWLLIDEIQSDWHQAGRRDGFQDSELLRRAGTNDMRRYLRGTLLQWFEDNPRVLNASAGFANLRIAFDAFAHRLVQGDPLMANRSNFRVSSHPTDAGRYIIELASRDGTSFSDVTHQVADKWEYQSVEEAEADIDKGVVALQKRMAPDIAIQGALPEEMAEHLERYVEMMRAWSEVANQVPDVPMKKVWHELGFKRAIEEAVNTGAKGVAWTTGEQQSDRYDLVRQLSSVDYVDNGNGTYDVTPRGYNGNPVQIANGVTEDAIGGSLGVDVAARIKAGEGTAIGGGVMRLSGGQLSVGGEGMKGFYDRILPSFAKKYAKKWNTRPGAVLLQTEEGSTELEEFHALPIPEQMAEDIREQGQPLYQLRAADRLPDPPEAPKGSADTAIGRIDVKPRYMQKAPSYDDADYESHEFATVNNRLSKEVEVYERLLGTLEGTNIVPGANKKMTRAARPKTMADAVYDMVTKNRPVIERLMGNDVPIRTIVSESHTGTKKSFNDIWKAISSKKKVSSAKIARKLKLKREVVDNIRWRRDDIQALRSTTPLLANNGKAGFSVDFPLWTCYPTTPCRECYAAASMIRASSVRKAFRLGFKMLMDPKQFGLDVAAEVNKKSRINVPFVRLLGSGDLTFDEQITAFNTLAENIDRPIHIFSRHHDMLAKLKNQPRAPFVKMGSLDAQLVDHYGMDFLKENFKERGIANAFLYTDLSELPVIQELSDANALQLVLTADETGTKGLQDALPEGIAMSSCPCDAGIERGGRHFSQSCKQCALGDVGCFMAFAQMGVDNNGKLWLLNDENRPEDLTRLAVLDNVSPDRTVKDRGKALSYVSVQTLQQSIKNVGIRRRDLKKGTASTVALRDIRFGENQTVTRVDNVKDVEKYEQELKSLQAMAKKGTFYLPGGSIQPPRAFENGVEVSSEEDLERIRLATTAESNIRHQIKAPDTAEFRNWFGDSKVVDENGEPLVVYHGSPTAQHNIFKSTKYKNVAGYFARDPAIASMSTGPVIEKDRTGEESVYPVFLSIENPLDLTALDGEEKISIDDFVNALPFDVPEGQVADYKQSLRDDGYSDAMPIWSLLSRDIFRDLAMENGFDGIKYNEGSVESMEAIREEGEDKVESVESYIAFNSTQVKSATGNRGTYDPANPDIRHQIKVPNTDEFRAWFGESKIVDAFGKPMVLYHGTRTEDDFSVFGDLPEMPDGWVSERAGTMNDPSTYMGSHFTSNPDVANMFAGKPIKLKMPSWMQWNRGELRVDAEPGTQAAEPGRVYPVFMSMQNPKRFAREEGLTDFYLSQDVSNSNGFNDYMDFLETQWTSEEEGDEVAFIEDTYGNEEDIRVSHNREILSWISQTDDMIESAEFSQELANAAVEQLQSEGYDGVIYGNSKEGGTAYIIFEPTQVKSAIGNDGTYSRVDPDIRHQIRIPETEEFKEFIEGTAVVDYEGNVMPMFHGSRASWNIPDASKSELGTHFTSQPEIASDVAERFGFSNVDGAPNLYAVALNIKNPLRLTDPGIWDFANVADQLRDLGIASSDELSGVVLEMKRLNDESILGEDVDFDAPLRDLIQSKGFDGVVYLNRREMYDSSDREDSDDAWLRAQDAIEIDSNGMVEDDVFFSEFPMATDSYIAFQPTQVKSITGNRGTYDSTDPDIRHQLRANQTLALPPRPMKTEEAKSAWGIVQAAKSYRPEEGEVPIKHRVLFHSGTGDPASVRGGVEPVFGDWVAEVLAGATDEQIDPDESFVPVSFYDNVPNWVRMQVGRKIGKHYDAVTREDIRENGYLAVVYNVDESTGEAVHNSVFRMVGEPDGAYSTVENAYGEEQNLGSTELYEEDLFGGSKEPFGLEPGDFVTTESIEPDVLLTGDALLEFMDHYKYQNPDIRFQLRAPQTPEFKAWFGESKAVDENGEPLVVYHGTNQSFDQFSTAMGAAATGATSAEEGFFFVSDPDVAEDYANNAAAKMRVDVGGYEREMDRLQKESERLEAIAQRTGNPSDWDSAERAMSEWEDYDLETLRAPDSGQTIMPTFLRLENPYEIDAMGKEVIDIGGEVGSLTSEIQKARAAGHDGVIIRDFVDAKTVKIPADHYVIFDSAQAKSATGNDGSYGLTNPDIRYQQRVGADKAKADPYRVNVSDAEFEAILKSAFEGVPESGTGGTFDRATPNTLMGAGLARGRNVTYSRITNEETEAAIRSDLNVPRELRQEKLNAEQSKLMREGAETSAYNAGMAMALIAARQQEYSELRLRAQDAEIAQDFESAQSLKELADESLDSAYDIATTHAERMTAAGQFIQAAKMVTRFSPEQTLYWATRRVNAIAKQSVNDYSGVRRGFTQKETDRLIEMSRQAQAWGELGDISAGMTEAMTRMLNGDQLTGDDLTILKNLSQQIQDISGGAGRLNDKDPVKKKAKRSKRAKKTMADMVVDRLTNAEVAARKRMAERGIVIGAGVDPQLMADYAIIGAAKLARGITKFDPWKKAMVEDFGEDFSPISQAVYGEAQRRLSLDRKLAYKVHRQARAVEELVERLMTDYGITEDTEQIPLESVKQARKDVRMLAGLIGQLKTMSGDEQLELSQEIQQTLLALKEPNFWRKVSTLQYIGHLSSTVTHMRNIVGNEAFWRLERLRKYIESPIDYLRSQYTGRNEARQDLVDNAMKLRERIDGGAEATAEDMVAIGAGTLADEGGDFLNWSRAMTQDFGEGFGTQEAYEAAKEYRRDFTSKAIAGARRSTFRTANQGMHWRAFMGHAARGDFKEAYDEFMSSPYWSGLVRGARLGWHGIQPGGLGTSYDIEPGIVFRNKGYLQRAYERITGTDSERKINFLGFMERATGASLRGFDYAAYQRARVQRLGEEAELEMDRRGLSGERRETEMENFVVNADEALQEAAHQYGLYMTFQDDSRTAEFFQSMKKALNMAGVGREVDPMTGVKGSAAFGAGDLFLKYPRTPGNLLDRSMNYSPIGFIKAAIDLRKVRKAQAAGEMEVTNIREVEASFTRALIGTGGGALAYFLFNAGVLTAGDTDDDPDERAFMRETIEESPYSINMSAIYRWAGDYSMESLRRRDGDLWYTYNWLAPLGVNIAAGAQIAKGVKKQALKSAIDLGPEEVLVTGAKEGWQAMEGLSVLRGIKDLTGGFGGSLLDAALGQGASLPSQFISNSIYQVRKMVDPLQRELYRDPDYFPGWGPEGIRYGQIVARMMNKIPGLSDKLPISYKTLGENVPREFNAGIDNPWLATAAIFLSPGFFSVTHIDEASQMMLDLSAIGETAQYPRRVGKSMTISRSMVNEYIVPRTNGETYYTGGITVKMRPEHLSEMQRLTSIYATRELRQMNRSSMFAMWNLTPDRGARVKRMDLLSDSEARKRSYDEVRYDELPVDEQVLQMQMALTRATVAAKRDWIKKYLQLYINENAGAGHRQTASSEEVRAAMADKFMDYYPD